MADFYTDESLQLIGRELGSDLAIAGITGFEFAHWPEHIERYAAQSDQINDALRRVATAQARQTGGDAAKRHEQLTKLFRQSSLLLFLSRCPLTDAQREQLGDRLQQLLFEAYREGVLRQPDVEPKDALARLASLQHQVRKSNIPESKAAAVRGLLDDGSVNVLTGRDVFLSLLSSVRSGDRYVLALMELTKDDTLESRFTRPFGRDLL